MPTTDKLENALAFAASDLHEGDVGAILMQAKVACQTLANEIERLQNVNDAALTAIEFVLGGVVDAAVSTEDLDPGIAVDLIGMMEAALSEANRAFTPFRNDQPSMGDGK